MYCPYCKHENLDDAAFCENCGRPFSPVSLKEKRIEYRICPKCRAKNSAQDFFCTSCGFEMRKPAEGEQQSGAGTAGTKNQHPGKTRRKAGPSGAARSRRAGGRKNKNYETPVTDSMYENMQWYVDNRTDGGERVFEIVTGILALIAVAAVVMLIVIPRHRAHEEAKISLVAETSYVPALSGTSSSAPVKLSDSGDEKQEALPADTEKETESESELEWLAEIMSNRETETESEPETGSEPESESESESEMRVLW